MSIRPLIFFPEELHSTLADGKRFGGAADNPAQLLEVRTESGTCAGLSATFTFFRHRS
jgi:hypothetical protein